MKWKEIMKRVDQLQNGEALRFKIHETFGGGFAIIELNPKYPAKKEKKYVLKRTKDIMLTEQASPFFGADKSKKLAKWVADRLGELVS